MLCFATTLLMVHSGQDLSDRQVISYIIASIASFQGQTPHIPILATWAHLCSWAHIILWLFCTWTHLVTPCSVGANIMILLWCPEYWLGAQNMSGRSGRSGLSGRKYNDPNIIHMGTVGANIQWWPLSGHFYDMWNMCYEDVSLGNPARSQTSTSQMC